MLNRILAVNKIVLFSSVGMILFCIAGFMALYSNGISKTETPYFSYIVILLFLAGLFLFFGQEKKDRSIKGGKFLIIFFFIYSLWLFFEPYTSTWFDMSRLSTWILFLTPISFFISSFIKFNKYQLKVVSFFYFVSGFFLFCWSILHFVVMRQRPEGPTNDSNVFAGLLLFFVVPLTIYWLITKFDSKRQRRQSDFILLYLLFGYLGFFATHSRSATGAFIIIGCLLLIKFYKDGFAFSIKQKLLPIAFIIITSFAAISWFGDFSSMTRDISEDRSSLVRLEMWKAGINIYKESNKLTGIGFSQFPEFYARNRPASDTTTAGFHAHNDYIEFLVEGGLVQFLFFVVLSIYIIYSYLRLFFSKSKDRNNQVLGFVGLSLCCVYFIQANVNFIFYVAPIAIFLGILLAFFNRTGIKKQSALPISGGIGLTLLVISAVSLLMFLLNLYISLYFYFLSSNLSEEKYENLFEQSQVLSVINPRTLSLPHFNLKYQLAQITKDDYQGNLDNDLAYVNNELNRAIRNKNYDADTVKFLAKYQFENPKIYQELGNRYPKQKLFALDSEQLYLLSIEYNPLIFGSYLALRNMYLEQGNKLKAYELIRDGIVDAPNYGVFIGYFQAMSINMVLEDALELGLQDEAEKYAKRILKEAPCFTLALEVMKKEKPSDCKK